MRIKSKSYDDLKYLTMFEKLSLFRYGTSDKFETKMESLIANTVLLRNFIVEWFQQIKFHLKF